MRVNIIVTVPFASCRAGTHRVYYREATITILQCALTRRIRKQREERVPRGLVRG